MASRSGFQLLEAEHGVLRAGLRRALDACAPEPRRPPVGLRSLVTGLKRHLRREDRALYPLCERLFTGWEGAVSVLKAEHDALRTHLARLATASNRPDRAALLRALEDLDQLLDAHFAREERVLFPLTSARMSETDHTSLVRSLRSSERTGGRRESA